MIFSYLQTIPTGRNSEVLFRITILSSEEDAQPIIFNLRPEISISKKIFENAGLDRMEFLTAPPFCDIAEDLIQLYTDRKLVFLNRKQFSLLKHQFRVIGFNFNISPILVSYKKGYEEDFEDFFEENAENLKVFQSSAFAIEVLHFMKNGKLENKYAKVKSNTNENRSVSINWSNYKPLPGVYYFLNEFDDVIYVGKARNVRKRLQSHFSSQEKNVNVNYSEVKNITIEYTGNDTIAQLLESHDIKSLKPIYNTQQINNAAPFIINKTTTASGISKLKITRKDIKDNLPEKYFNRESVKNALSLFRETYGLCRKFCGIESVKGACSDFKKGRCKGVCAGEESVELYNERFEKAIQEFESRKSRKIYKLKGRNPMEDAFIYTVNDVYEGYGFIDKTEACANLNDILGYLTPQKNNYDTSRILGGLEKNISKENILTLSNN